jgi:hypothetical protein
MKSLIGRCAATLKPWGTCVEEFVAFAKRYDIVIPIPALAFDSAAGPEVLPRSEGFGYQSSVFRVSVRALFCGTCLPIFQRTDVEQLENFGPDLTRTLNALLPHCQTSLLRQFSLSHWGIREIPNHAILSRFNVLDFSFNLISEVQPGGLSRITHVHSLTLSHCGLRAIPAEIGLLREMRYLDVSHNELESLPEAIGQCAELQTINVKFNRLRSLPVSIGRLSSLRTLALKGNSSLVLGMSVRTGGVEAIQKWLREVEEQPAQVAQVKLMVMGHGGTGMCFRCDSLQ